MKSKRRKPVSGSKRKLQEAREPKAAKERAPSSDAVLEVLRAADADYRDRRSKYEQFLVVNRDRPSLDRAVAWLQFIAADIENYGDYEALVYLASHGLDVTQLIETAVDQWKNDEETAIAASVRGIPIDDPAKNKTPYSNPLLPSEVSDIEHASEGCLRQFWYGYKPQDFSLDATMLRTVEWCRIGGFERWWRRLARLTNENVIRGGIEVGSAISYLFNMVRSNLALEIMPGAMSRILEAVELRQDGEPPWISTRPFPGRNGPEYRRIVDIGYAGALVFATFRIRGNQARTALVEEAGALLQRTQHANGAWPMWLQKSSTAIEETAIATHALAILKPLGWERQTRKAAAWLLEQQNAGGFWHEHSSPDPTYLTVLVLDAVALAEGRNDVTFRASPSAELHCGEKLSPTDTLDCVRLRESPIRLAELEREEARLAALNAPPGDARGRDQVQSADALPAQRQKQTSAVNPTYPSPYEGLKPEMKVVDFSNAMLAAQLTAKQYDCYSLAKEYQRPMTEVEQRMGITRKTIHEHIAAAEKAMKKLTLREFRAKTAAKHKHPE